MDFAPIGTKETTSVTSVCFPEHVVPSEKGSTLKGKTLLHLSANSFLIEQNSFRNGGKAILTPSKVYPCTPCHAE